MSLQSKQGLRTKLENDKYRDAFVASRIAQTLAFQSRVLRQRKELSQAELAKELGTSQNAISRIENPRYGKHSITTLRKIASHHKVGLIVRFAPLSEIVDWTLSLSERSLDVPDLDHDPGFIDHKGPTSAADTRRQQIQATGTEPIARSTFGASGRSVVTNITEGRLGRVESQGTGEMAFTVPSTPKASGQDLFTERA